ncbi:hypothetical protein HD806DRAFT_523868 [Xylariaceae sp. AK1471]|nr:hypothetical protein HD806DRAFT_523868 [Xylariaceae sp. AK1471]
MPTNVDDTYTPNWLAHFSPNGQPLSGVNISVDCPICSTALAINQRADENHEMFTVLPCGHAFGYDCLGHWFISNNNCPTCRRQWEHRICRHPITLQPFQGSHRFNIHRDLPPVLHNNDELPGLCTHCDPSPPIRRADQVSRSNSPQYAEVNQRTYPEQADHVRRNRSPLDDDEYLQIAIELSLQDSGHSDGVTGTRSDDDENLRMALELSLQDAGHSNSGNNRSFNSGLRNNNGRDHALRVNEFNELEARQTQLVTTLRMQPELLQQLPSILPTMGINRIDDNSQLLAVINEIQTQSLEGYLPVRPGGIIIPEDNVSSPRNNNHVALHHEDLREVATARCLTHITTQLHGLIILAGTATSETDGPPGTLLLDTQGSSEPSYGYMAGSTESRLQVSSTSESFRLFLRALLCRVAANSTERTRGPHDMYKMFHLMASCRYMVEC